MTAATAERTAQESWELVTRAQHDPEAFAAIYTRYLDTVFRYVYHRIGANRPVAQDITSDVFARALRSIGRVEWRGQDIGAWLVTIARNRVNDYWKSATVRREHLAGDVRGVDLSSTGHAVQSPEQIVMADVTAGIIRAALAELGHEQRRCIELRFLVGLSVAETAEVMGKRPGAVKALQYRAVRSLARQPLIAQLRAAAR